MPKPEPSPSRCEAPAWYFGHCQHFSHFNGYSAADKEDWSLGCHHPNPRPRPRPNPRPRPRPNPNLSPRPRSNPNPSPNPSPIPNPNQATQLTATLVCIALCDVLLAVDPIQTLTPTT